MVSQNYSTMLVISHRTVTHTGREAKAVSVYVAFSCNTNVIQNSNNNNNTRNVYSAFQEPKDQKTIQNTNKIRQKQTPEKRC